MKYWYEKIAIKFIFAAVNARKLLYQLLSYYCIIETMFLSQLFNGINNLYFARVQTSYISVLRYKILVIPKKASKIRSEAQS